MRILFITHNDFGEWCLEQVPRAEGNVVGIVSTKTARHSADYSDVALNAKLYHIPFHDCRNINDPHTIKWMQVKNPDIIFCWGWSQLIKKEVLDIAPVIGVHPTLLPRGRGRHPLVWTLIKGLRESGLTFFWITDGPPDSGPILWQLPFGVKPTDTPKSLYIKIKVLAGFAISEFLPQLILGIAPRIPQDESKATYWRKRTKEEKEAFTYDPV